MAGGSSPSPNNHSGKKSIDFQLNMVPFIDLLSVMLAFLLMTSVWTQVSKVDVRQAPNQPGKSEDAEQKKDDPQISVLIKASGYEVSRGGEPLKEIPKQGELYDQVMLTKVLEELKTSYPDNHNITLTSEDRIAYRELIRVMDICLIQKLDAISVAGVDA